MKGFSGFPAGKVRFTRIPEQFFSELLPQIDELAELKITLHLFWLMQRKEGDVRFATLRELMEDEALLSALGEKGQKTALEEALARAVERGTLLQVHVEQDDQEDELYFFNTPKGRLILEKIERGELEPEKLPHLSDADLRPTRPNIFTLYEQNIGLLQPLIAEELREAEEKYPTQWIEDAFRIAAEQNARRWSYIKKILKRWETEGKDDGKLKRDY
ncbi:MAG: DnaD domain-containing protein [Anaerolineae bacterium]